MKEDEDEERLLREVGLQSAKSIFLARQRAEEELIRTKEALWKQSEWLRVTLASIGDAVVTTDTEGRVLSVNSVAESLMGWTQQEAEGRPLVEIFRIVNEETRQPVENPAERALKEGRVVGLANHTILIARDGTEIPLDDSAAPIRDDQGRVYGVVLIFRSIAERRRAEKALHESERELADFFENASVGMHWVGPDGTILKVNRAELGLLGYSREEYVGHNIAEFHADREVIADILRRLAAGEILRDCEARMVCKNGAIKHVLIDSSVLWQGDRFVHTRCFTRDMTDHKRAEEAQARLAAIVESSQDAIISKTLEGRILSWNSGAEQTFGYSAEEAVGQPITLLIPPELHDEERMILERLRRGEHIEHYETVRVTKQGRRINVSLTISPVRDSDGRIIGASKISKDITTRKRDEQRLATQYGITRTLGESSSLDEAAPRILQAICEHLGWQVGALWSVDEDEKLLRCVEVYHLPEVEVPQFEAESRKHTFEQGKGLPGRIWSGGKSIWIGDVVEESNFPRAVFARAEGLHGAFGFPIRLNGEILGVVEFFSHEIRKPDEDMLQMMTAIGSQIGQFIERKRAEQALRESEQQLRLALEAGRMGTWEWDIATNKVIWSAGLEAIHGLAPGTFEGTFDAFQKDMPPEDREQVLRSIIQTLEQGKDHNVEYRIILPGGGTRWVEERGKLFRDKSGAPARLVGVCSDITERKRVEQTAHFLADASATLAELTDTESTLQKVASLAVPHFADWCAVDVLEGDGSLRRLAVAHVDPAKVQLAHELNRKYPSRASETRGVRQVIRTGEPEWTASIPDEMLVSLTKSEEHLRIIRELGFKSYISVPLKSRNQVLGALTFVTAESGRVYTAGDVRAAEDLAHRAVIAIENASLLTALKESDRRKDEFLAMLAHELRNPLAPLRNAVQILRAKGPDLPELTWARDLIDRQIDQMTRLIDDLLDVSRITRGKIELRKQRFELRSVVTDAVEASRPIIEELGHRLSVELPPEPIILEADPTRLTQVLLNLLNNAAKYTEQGGNIWLNADREGGQVVILVKDTGIGIPPEMLPRIFDMFTQVDRSIERSQGGLGIGLTLARQLIAMHGGDIEARSQGPGKGSEFIVRLSVAGEGQHVVQQDSAEGKTMPTAARRRILVVDDNQDSADSLAMFLNIMGHEVHTAHDGLTAVEEAEVFEPSVILLDIGLPKLNGYDVARRIREIRGGEVVLIALTGWGQEEDRRRSREAGFDHHLTKPVDFNELDKLLADVNLDKSHRR